MLISLHEFIKTEGKSYIDFGIKCKSTLKIQLGLKMAQATGDAIIGGIGSGEANQFRFFNYNNNAYLDFGSGAGYNRIYGGTISPNTYYDIEIGNRYVKNMSTGGYFCSSSSVSFADKTYNLQYARDTGCIGWLYYIKIYDSDVLVIDGVPALCVSKTGIYDKVSKKFIENSGTEEFILGKQIGTVSDRKYLISDSEKYYTVVDSALSEISIAELNAQAFQDYGFDDFPDGALLIPLYAPEVLCWTDAETLPTLTATVKGIPQPQVIVSEEINLIDGSIKGIESVAIDCKGEPIFAVSFDKKATWIMHNGTDWVNVADEATGMTKTEFEAITTEQWQEQYEASSEMYIRCTILDETQSITTLNIDFIN